MLKVQLDRLQSMLLLSFAMGAFGFIMLLIAPFPARASVPFVIGSAVIHSGYKLFLIRAYGAGDLTQVYPLARGTAPLLTTIAAYFLLGERLSPLMMSGVALVLAGIYVVGVHGGSGIARLDGRAIGFALLTSAFIAAYTLVDGIGVRASLSSAGYTAATFLADCALFSTVVFGWRGSAILRGLRTQWHKGIVAGGLSFGSYWIALWAMTDTPIAAVAALRETSIFFALLLGAFWLKESITPARVAAALLIVSGAAALRFG